MNKVMLDRLRSAVCEGSQQSAESRPDKAAVQRWINDHFTASPPGVCAHCGGGEKLADIGNTLEATIRFSGIENEGTRFDLQDFSRERRYDNAQRAPGPS